MTAPRGLSDVPEEGSFTPAIRTPSPRSPYSSSNLAATASSSTFNASPTSPRQPPLRRPSSLRNVRDRSSREPSAASLPQKRNTSPTSSLASVTLTKDTQRTPKINGATPTPAPPQQRIRNTPRLPHDHEVELAPATLMYWSRAPVYGAIPMRSMRAHTVTLVDNIAWLFGGCDEKGSWRDIYCFDTGASW